MEMVHKISSKFIGPQKTDSSHGMEGHRQVGQNRIRFTFNELNLRLELRLLLASKSHPVPKEFPEPEDE